MADEAELLDYEEETTETTEVAETAKEVNLLCYATVLTNYVGQGQLREYPQLWFQGFSAQARASSCHC